MDEKKTRDTLSRHEGPPFFPCSFGGSGGGGRRRDGVGSLLDEGSEDLSSVRCKEVACDSFVDDVRGVTGRSGKRGEGWGYVSLRPSLRTIIQ